MIPNGISRHIVQDKVTILEMLIWYDNIYNPMFYPFTLAECDTSRCPDVVPCPIGFATNITKTSGDCCIVYSCGMSQPAVTDAHFLLNLVWLN